MRIHISHLGGRGHSVAASLRPAWDIMSSSQSKFYIVMFSCFFKLIFLDFRVQGQGLWEGSGWPTLWFECRIAYEGVITPGAGNQKAATRFCNSGVIHPVSHTTSCPHLLTKPAFFLTPLLLPCFQTLTLRDIPQTRTRHR